MKKILTIIVLALATLSLNAKDIVKNKATGAVLNETAGVYSVRGTATGAIILGDTKATIKTLSALNGCFLKEGMEKILDAEFNKEYEVHQDKDGHWYVICLKAGGAKLYASDVNLFLATLTGRTIIDGVGKTGEWVSKKSKEILK